MSVRFIITDSHKNMSKKRKDALLGFFCEVKGIDKEAAEKQVEFCDWYESEFAVKWFEVLAVDNGDIAGYLRCFRNPDDVHQWFIGDVHVRTKYRRTGIASRMYERVFSELERYEAAENIISAVRKDNINSIGLHTKMGFYDTGEPCRFATFFVDENETKYQKWLYRHMPAPDEVSVEKLTEVFLPVWLEAEKTNAGKAKKELKAVLNKARKEGYEIGTVWCGNRLVGFKAGNLSKGIS